MVSVLPFAYSFRHYGSTSMFCVSTARDHVLDVLRMRARRLFAAFSKSLEI